MAMEIKKSPLLSFLFENQDLAYQAFQRRLIPNIDPDKIIGVRMPILKALAKDLIKNGKDLDYFQNLNQAYYEEKQVYIQLLNLEKDFDRALYGVERILAYMDNWALTDALLPKAFQREPEKILHFSKAWAQREEEFIGRFGVFLLMRLELKGTRAKEAIDFVAKLKSQAYYKNMVLAWFFAEALIYEPDKVFQILEEGKLDPWVHNKAIQKARESLRISPDVKKTLKEKRA